MSTLLLLDGHSLAYRAFFALPAENFSTSTGQFTNAVHGFTSMLVKVLADEKPTHVAVAFDVSRENRRSREYPEYKAGRAKTPDEFKGQVDLVREVLDALQIRHVGIEGHEADDVIATLSHKARAEGLEVLICSGDRDTMQLVGDGTTVLYPVRGVSELARMDPDEVEAKYGVSPQLYPDLAAMVGESADNLPGVPGVGPKTAAKWIAKFGDLKSIVARADELTGKAGQSFRDHVNDVERNRRLNALDTDVETGVEVSELERRGIDREAVHRIFDSLEFRVLRDRVLEVLGGEGEEATTSDSFEVEGERLASDEVADWLSKNAPSGTRTGVHVVGTWGRGTGDATALAVATQEAAAYIDLTELDAEGEAAVASWLGDDDRPKVLHEAKGPLHALAARGLDVAGIVVDTALAAYLVRPDQRSYDLSDLTMRHLHRELDAEDAGSGQDTLDLGFTDEDVTFQPAVVRARAVLDLAEVLEGLVDEAGGTELMRTMELPLLRVLADMERDGIAVDREAMASLKSEFSGLVATAQQDAWNAIDGEQVNLGSPKQLQVVLFDKLGLPKTKRTKTGYTTNAEALEGLYAKTEHPFLEALLRHRDATRLAVTVEGLIKSVSDDGRIHTTYQQTIAATGRLSSVEPNLQNIPVRTAAGRRIRELFVVGPEHEMLMSVDYSQIEMRIMAHLSGDEGLIQAFREGEDLHRFVGSRVFAVKPEDVTPEMRAKVKAMSYGLAYGLSAYGLANQLRVPAHEAQELMDEYFERFGGVRDYLARVVDEARSQGYTETMFGRRRYLPDLTSTNRQRRENAERMALNAPIQGTAADLIKKAMLGVHAALQARGAKSRMLLQVHDELVLEVAKGEEADVEKLVRDEMAGAGDLSVPLDVAVGIGRTWHDAAH